MIIKGTFPNDFFGWILLAFALGSITLTGSGQLRAIGLLLAASYTLYFLKNKLWLPPEMIIYFFWILWAGATGYLISIDKSAFLNIFKVSFQTTIMSFAIIGITAHRRSIGTNFLALLIGGILLFLSSITSGELSSVTSNPDNVLAGVTGMTENPNTFGFNLLLCSTALLYFWKNNTSLIKRIIIILLMCIFSYGIIISASRKAFLGFALLIFLWLFFCYRKEILRRLSLFIPILLALGGLYFATDYMISNTYLGKRFQGKIGREMSFVERENKRITLYKDGLNILKQNPVFGVGLGNFKVYSTYGIESHSDFIEIITSTGIIGFSLYFFIYISLWRRLSRVQKQTEDPSILYNIRLFKIIILAILALGFGRPNFKDQITWVAISSIIGYTWSLEKKLLDLKKSHRV